MSHNEVAFRSVCSSFLVKNIYRLYRAYINVTELSWKYRKKELLKKIYMYIIYTYYGNYMKSAIRILFMCAKMYKLILGTSLKSTIILILGVLKRNPLFFHSISCKNNGFLFIIPNINC